jgi:hypothetical protein
MKLHPGLHLQLEGEDPERMPRSCRGSAGTDDGTDQRREVEPHRLVHLGRASRPASPGAGADRMRPLGSDES